MVGRDARDQYRAARLSYYHTAEGQGWDRTFLGYDQPTQADELLGEIIGGRAGVASCLHCHITYPRAGRDRIGCERCHGPGGNHLTAVAAGFSDPAIVNPAFTSSQAVTVKRCNGCHILDPGYQHGDREKAGWVRSQGAGWDWSRCNTASEGAFGGVTCHDPHRGPRSITITRYEAKCRACHSAATVQPASAVRAERHAFTKSRPKICSVDSAKGCINCHMPGVRIEASHRELTDHDIRIPRASTAQQGGASSKG
jgi:hypothetical protein